jgi:hypothetical protein
MADGLPGATNLHEEARLGIEALRTMTPDELRQVIDSRVQMLDNVLRERELRREALETAKLASKILDLRQARSRKIQKNVNIGSAVAAAACTILIVAVMV